MFPLNLNYTNEDNYFFDNNCAEMFFVNIFLDQLQKAIQISASATCVICIIIFYKIVINERTIKGQMYKYFLIKSVNDLLFILIQISDIIYFCHKCGRHLLDQIWYIIVYNYFVQILSSLSAFFEVAASFDCYLTINDKFKFLFTKNSFYTTILIAILFNFILSVDYILIFERINFNLLFPNETKTSTSVIYGIKYSNYYYTKIHKVLNYIVDINRDLLPVFALFIINILILLKLRDISKRRETVFKQSKAQISRIHKAEINKIKMILVISFSYILTRLPYMIYLLPIHGFNIFWECYYLMSVKALYHLSFLIQIIFHYFFNKTFQKYFYFLFKRANSQANINDNDASITTRV
jgi:hypothetical protein